MTKKTLTYPAPKIKLFANALIFQLAWAGIIYSNTIAMTELGWVFTALTLALHFFWVSSTPKQEALLLLPLSALGFGVDTLALNLGLLQFTQESPGWLPPVWLFLIWMVFVTTLKSSLSVFVRKPRLGAIFAFMGAPITYGLTGSYWDLTTYQAPQVLSMALHGALWALLFGNLNNVITGFEKTFRSLNQKRF